MGVAPPPLPKKLPPPPPPPPGKQKVEATTVKQEVIKQEQIKQEKDTWVIFGRLSAPCKAVLVFTVQLQTLNTMSLGVWVVLTQLHR